MDSIQVRNQQATMDKRQLSEQEIRTRYITPAIESAGWDIATQVREELKLTDGRVLVRGNLHTRAKHKRADYVLFYTLSVPLAIVEAKRNSLPLGDRTNSYELVGKSAIYSSESNIATFASYLIRIRLAAKHLFPRYVSMAMNAPYFREKQIKPEIVQQCGQANFNGTKLSATLIPLPPLAEQRRIVAKIDQLMARCDELEKLRETRDRLRIKVHMAACDRLLTAPDTDTFTQSWQFITQHFSELYTVKENVVELRKVILQLAVMGKLVPQDPKNLSASELLDKIKTEKQKLVKEKKIKKPKSFPDLKEQDIPYNLPKGWEWTRLVNLAKQIDYGTSQKAGTDPSQIPVYRMGNIVDGQLLNENLKYVSPDIDDLPRLYLRSNDILFNRTNSYELVGKTAIYFSENEAATFASYLIRIRLFEEHLFSSYFGLAMNASYFRETQIEPEIIQQCGQANFNGTKLAATVIPLPPLAEQHRIVTKVDQLMFLCDTLEQQIDATTQTQTALLNAVTAKL